MEKKIVISLIIAFAALTGCSSDKNTAEPAASSAAVSTESQPSASPTEAPTAVPKKLSDTEKLALDFINTFLNGSDLEAKKNFITENVYPDAQPFFQMTQSMETPDNHKLKNPQVLESVDYADEKSMKVEAVLIQGEEGSNPKSELIVLINNKKVLWATDPSDKETFSKVRGNFKEPIPDASLAANAPDPSDMLREILSFVISDVWNDGFVDISSYISSGTSSTGETMDVDFTVEQLAKTMDKKKEYDSYIAGLGAEYDSLKKVWTKLSPEIDRLYGLIQKNPPKANDTTVNFDTGIFNQYMDAFKKEVDAVTK
ncbi:hypothetical protein [Paenibacillus riograndensis]|uniref:hypothetical protein n=1 Tax=Paenibacillus riograndensis TaxID=483937 RepID=UPI000764C18C|nr:hypothetical protein [Paenibacillus riograndensis]